MSDSADRGQGLGRMVKELFAEGRLPLRRKCCGKCAFRANSPERCDPWGWLRYVEHWTEDDGVFLCHEGVPGHHQQAEGIEICACAGWNASRGRSAEELMKLAYDEEREPDPRFGDGASCESGVSITVKAS